MVRGLLESLFLCEIGNVPLSPVWNHLASLASVNSCFERILMGLSGGWGGVRKFFAGFFSRCLFIPETKHYKAS